MERECGNLRAIHSIHLSFFYPVKLQIFVQFSNVNDIEDTFAHLLVKYFQKINLNVIDPFVQG